MRSTLAPNNRIGWFAARAGLADGALAVRARLSRAQLNRIKNRRAIPRIDTAIAIARALGVSVEQLYHTGV
jgi:transcriptional regulator with XRE-family HTH domain